ncbi:hypothetical protein JL721_8215 [Aureococcus anophagefferens]|nr:hypothetical protein JL721_8215 [Aureococcus anophagefferens]
MIAAARAALCGVLLLPRLSAETIQEHLLELGKQSFENFENLDLIPENSHLYPRYNKLRGGGSYANEGFEVRHKHCEVPSDCDGGTWSIEMIGPMYSTGGYDWWQLGWADLWKLGDKYDEHGPSTPRTRPSSRDAKTGRRRYPPIHIHHIHIGPQPGVRPRTGEYDGSLPKPCNNVSWFFEWHGDHECDDDEGGGLPLRSRPRASRATSTKVDLEGEINDVRAAGDEAFGWYFEVAIKWFTHDKILEKMGGVEPRPLSTFFNVGVPGRFDLNNQQTYVGTFPAPIAYDSVIWYNMRMFNNGILIRWKFHSHLLSFYKFMLVSGDVRDLLDERFNLAPLWKRKFYGDPWNWKEGTAFGIGWNLKKTFKHTINEKPGSNGLLDASTNAAL